LSVAWADSTTANQQLIRRAVPELGGRVRIPCLEAAEDLAAFCGVSSPFARQRRAITARRFFAGETNSGCARRSLRCRARCFAAALWPAVQAPLAAIMSMQSTGQGGRHSAQADAPGPDHVVHQLMRADDRVHRAGLDAARAARCTGLRRFGQWWCASQRRVRPAGIARQLLVRHLSSPHLNAIEEIDVHRVSQKHLYERQYGSLESEARCRAREAEGMFGTAIVHHAFLDVDRIAVRRRREVSAIPAWSIARRRPAPSRGACA